ncbi:MAG: DNA polymerase III, subunit gamma and tau [Parcubacteria bacterium C7867-001]|nr:MAG: DNA polymerase III, subunit gamma and tau [Parcubacteria bacterium C7867-001]
MSHQSLYRKHRPHSFKDVVGQDSVIAPLKEQLASEKVGHAYLFAGSRGLGKTSIARIFARELGTDERDLYEIDAASNNSVEDIRNLTENVYTLPFASKHKVYILDEAHMLSKGAWNAFLKTLEEPPAHAIFILATTELSKVPETVQSRCQVYEFKRPSRETLAKVVVRVAKEEGVVVEPSAADLIALLAGGSYRDALSTLEKVLSSTTEKKITRENAEEATGAPRSELIGNLLRALSEGNADKALAAIRKAEKESIDLPLYLSLFIDALRATLLIRHAPELRKELAEELGEQYAELETIANAKESKISPTTLKTFLDASARIRFSPVPAVPLELAVLELLAE